MLFVEEPRYTESFNEAFSFLFNIIIPYVVGFLHIPVKPCTIWAGELRQERVSPSIPCLALDGGRRSSGNKKTASSQHLLMEGGV